MLKIYQNKNEDENKILRAKSRDVSEDEIKSSKFQKTIKEMLDYIEVQPDGAALAAPQIGINQRFFVVSENSFKSMDREVSYEDKFFINPKITNRSKKSEYMDEGCFSVRWYYGQAPRYKNITIEAYNLKGEKKKWNTGGFLAQVFQHEIDHLEGILFVDSAINVEKMNDEEIEKIKNLEKEMRKTKK